MTWWLEAGEDGSDRIDLMSGSGGGAGYTVLAEGFDVQPDGEYPDRYQYLLVPLSIQGSTTVDLLNKRRAILTKLQQARAAARAGSGQPWVNIGIKIDDSATLVRWYIVDGDLDRGSITSLPSSRLGAMQEPAVLTLRCLRGGLGEAIEYGPYTVTGADPTFFINGVPGDEPALAEFRILDESTNSHVVNRIRWACRSLPSMTEDQFDPVEVFATDGNDDTDTFGGYYASITSSSTWQTIGSVSRAANVYDAGVLDVWLRLRDATASLGAPGDVEANGVEGISLVQCPSIAVVASGTSISNTWTQSTTAGNLLVAMVTIADSDTINTPSGWTLAASVGTNPKAVLFYKANAASESGSVTVTFGSAADNARLVIAEFRGIATSTPVDVSATNTETSQSSAATGTTSATAQANALAIALFSTGSGTFGAPSGYTVLGTIARHLSAFKKLAATGAQSATATSGATTDWANLIVVFKGATTSAPTVTADTYDVLVVAEDATGGLSAPSSATVVTLSATGAIYVEWTAASGPVDQYRVYIRATGGSWKYYETGSTATNYTITSNTADATADPPSASTITPGQFRVRIGPESGVTDDIVTPPFSASVANSTWEPVYAGRVNLPTGEMPLVASRPGWKLALQGKSDTGVQMDADAVLLLPADEQQMDVRYTADDLATLREWVVGTTPDMRSYGFLRDTGDSSEAGRLLPVGRALLGPGDCQVVMLPTVAGGEWNVEDVSVDVTVHVRPVYSWLVGDV